MDASSDYVTLVLPTVLLLGLGFALGFPALNIQGTAGVADDEQGLASGLVNTSLQVGGALVLAIVSAVVSSHAGGERRGHDRRLPRRGRRRERDRGAGAAGLGDRPRRRRAGGRARAGRRLTRSEAQPPVRATAGGPLRACAALCARLSAMAKGRGKRKIGAGDVASNRAASHRFNLLDKIECGIVLAEARR